MGPVSEAGSKQGPKLRDAKKLAADRRSMKELAG